MRIAVSGSHNTGKTTLIGALHELLPEFSIVEEPYYLLEDEGHVFPAMPGIEGFELQMERSIRNIEEGVGDTIFDRCPLDMLAYLICHDENALFDIERWLPLVRAGVQTLDLIVFVPIEEPERIDVSTADYLRIRRRVDEELHEIILEDRCDIGVPSIEVKGAPEERVQQVLSYIDGKSQINGRS